jgi:NAD(P)-dependent dehydrogenase (short-subunit alcohol dehydrogenase family)
MTEERCFAERCALLLGAWTGDPSCCCCIITTVEGVCVTIIMPPWPFSPTAEEITRDVDLTGKTYLVTGCASGLGLESCKTLSLRNAETVIVTARGLAQAQEACKRIAASSGKQAALLPLACDLSSAASVRECVAGIKARNMVLDGVLCNAGVMALPRYTQINNTEAHFAVNHLGHFILIQALLADKLLRESARVVVVSGDAYQWTYKTETASDVSRNATNPASYNPWRSYGFSKLCNIWFANELARRFPALTTCSLHPGVIVTELARYAGNANSMLLSAYRLIGPWVLKSPSQGAATQVFCLTSPAVVASGRYYRDCAEVPHSKLSADGDLAKELWRLSEQCASKL